MTADTRQNARVFIRDCRVDLHIGLNPGEQYDPQPVLISVEADYAPNAAFPDTQTKTRDGIIDYSAIHGFITRGLPALGHIGLLEAAAEQIITFCLRDPLVQRACVRIEKTAVFYDSAGAGVEITRARNAA